jgi:hypothetical protein
VNSLAKKNRIRLSGLLALALATGLGGGRASALEVTCIEASKYKYLFQIFGGDPRKFAAYFQLNANRLPKPELCRAALISGKVAPAKEGDADKLLEFILKNEGWLAALHLASGGGSVGTGYQLGFLTRSFWLKTYSVSTIGNALSYTPDFFVPPLPAPSPSAAPLPGVAPPDPPPDSELAKGWQAYLAEQKKLAPVTVATRSCASACGLIHSAGIDRFGTVWVHRARYSVSNNNMSVDVEKSMSATNEGLMRWEGLQMTFYQQMDTGPDFTRTYQATPTETVTPVSISRYPRYVTDHLNARCGTDVGQLQRLEREFNTTISSLSAPLFGQGIKTDRLRNATRTLRDQRTRAEQCVAAAHEKERLTAFDKMCAGGCSRQKLQAMVESKIRDLAKGSQ